MRLTRFIGKLEIGGPTTDNDLTGISSITTFNNLVGYINDYTLENYENWNP